MKHSQSSVRMGPISLVTLVIVLSMAVMTVLSVTTAKATFSSTERQAKATADIYTCETAGQEFLAALDGKLASYTSRTDALAALRTDYIDLLSGITTDGISSAVDIASSDDAQVAVSATFVTASNHRLSITLAINDNCTYRILSWKTTTFWNNNTSTDTLWSGSKD